ncbi:chalcone isomerase family protein [Rhodoferax koreense]|uniref:chalcone isomerase family protein n=1 Tax=Rhodoferax koreensis TaxID=1842727 RepID=UPI001EF472CB|nr:chalcone isomerase family protein [Rhodoferax koreense]
MNLLAQPAPAEVRAALPDAVAVGSTRLRVWGFAVYDATLWAAPGFRPEAYATQAFALELRYLRDFASADIARRSIDEMRRSASIDEARSQRWQAAMRAAFPDVKAGDRITGFYRPAGAEAAVARFTFNGQPAGEIRDGDFAPLFFGIWLSAKTSEPAMREALIGGDKP